MKKIWNAEEKLQYERALQAKGYRYIVGVDEVGRGPLAGPVVCAAVVMPLEESALIVGVDDSKKVSIKKREQLSELIKEKDHQLSGKWTSLFMWSIVVGLLLGFTSTSAGMFAAMAGIDTMKATIMIAAILAIPQYVIEIIYILYLKKMVGIFSEGNDGLEIR